MLDGTMSEECQVWGFTVAISPSGRRQWPEALRAQAVEKIKAGAGIRETAEELGTNKSLVALWVKRSEPDATALAFVETVIAQPKQSDHARGDSPAEDSSDMSCRISVGGMNIVIPPGYPADHLAEVLRAARAAQ